MSWEKTLFFKLMLAQLKQQDPTNPLKSHEMAAQLAQFSSVEQLTNINETLKNQGPKESQSFQGLNLIGRVVSGDSSRFQRLPTDSKHKIDFDLSQNADQVHVEIKNSSGQVVWSEKIQNLKKGPHHMSWDGVKRPRTKNSRWVLPGSY